MLEKVKPREDILINDVDQINIKSDLCRIIRACSFPIVNKK